jgi:hypothetical protein
MTDQTKSQALALPVCPVCLAKMLLSSVFPVIYPSGRRQFSYNFHCDRCRVQSSSIRSFAGGERLSMFRKELYGSPGEMALKKVSTSPEG